MRSAASRSLGLIGAALTLTAGCLALAQVLLGLPSDVSGMTARIVGLGAVLAGLRLAIWAGIAGITLARHGAANATRLVLRRGAPLVIRRFVLGCSGIGIATLVALPPSSAIPDDLTVPTSPQPAASSTRPSPPAPAATSAQPSPPQLDSEPAALLDPLPPPPVSGVVPEPVVAPQTYTVVPGDTLWDIAARHGGSDPATSWPAWWEANRSVIGPNPDLILPGQQLTVPTTMPIEEY